MGLRNEISSLLEEIKPCHFHSQFISFDRILTNRIIGFEKDTLDRKFRKLLRDRKDYNTGNIKFWQTNVTKSGAGKKSDADSKGVYAKIRPTLKRLPSFKSYASNKRPQV